jgi:hypothetical protein
MAKMELFSILIEQYPWESFLLYYFTQNTLPSLSQLHIHSMFYCYSFLRKSMYGNERNEVAVIDDWYSEIYLDT